MSNVVALQSPIQTARLTLRPWHPDDAVALGPILERDHAYLAPWIPARIATPASEAALRDRLGGFAADFATDRSWRFAMLECSSGALLGEVDLLPRNADARVPFAESDRAELGYWLRADRNGEGFVTEGVRALIDVARTLARFACLEIRCDERNRKSGAIPERLGFTLAETIDSDGVRLQVWVLGL